MSNGKMNKEQQLFHSLVKYDTPYLVSTTVNNKKALEELTQDTEKTNTILRSIFYRNKNTSSSNEETEDFSLKDALNKILPPKKIIMNGQLWVQYVSCTPVTKMEVVTLKNGLEKRLKTLNAKETGICPIREELYDECFDELIRQVTINCLERGILMMLVKQESVMTMKAYQDLYQSSIAYGIRNGLIAEEEKKKMRTEIEIIDEKNEKLEEDIEKLEKEIELLIKNDEEERREVQEKHLQEVAVREDQIKMLKSEIKNKWEILSKQMG
jgi:dynein light intermediate chain